jgi:hypothetical protein
MSYEKEPSGFLLIFVAALPALLIVIGIILLVRSIQRSRARA